MLLHIAASVVVVYSDMPVGLPLPFRSLLHLNPEPFLLVRDLDGIHTIERREAKKKPPPSQGSSLSAGGEKKSPSVPASQTTPTSSIGAGSSKLR